jgi:hypothetical protein
MTATEKLKNYVPVPVYVKLLTQKNTGTGTKYIVKVHIVYKYRYCN